MSGPAEQTPGAVRRARAQIHVRRLAEELNQARLARGMSHRAVAAALHGTAGCSPASVNRALGGETLVGRAATEAIGAAVGAPPDRVRALWEKAAANRTPVYPPLPGAGGRPTRRTTLALDRPLDLITQPHELMDAVRVLRAQRGRPALRTMAAAAARRGYAVGRSTIDEFLTGRAVPTWRTLQGCLAALGVAEREFEVWRVVWSRVTVAASGREGGPVGAVGLPPADGSEAPAAHQGPGLPPRPGPSVPPPRRPAPRLPDISALLRAARSGVVGDPSRRPAGRPPGVTTLLRFAEEAATTYAAESHFLPGVPFPGPAVPWSGSCASCRRPLWVVLAELRPGEGACGHCAERVIRAPRSAG
ncbi:helix-turn-helix domain-containing protein [Kitasatospora sp. NPDC059327]|uniref:helix-turn-helix domain-containing protein n=1 Tax=Kitasatospora sp. NPDC059327 TaxID=3346803 RepID=UPI00368260A1